MTLRVVQWTTGNVGRQSLRAIVANPLYELVGCYAWSDDKVGRDAGELCGLEPVGVQATNDVDALLALAPDCVSYNPLWPDVGELVRILEAGVNVASTAAFITGSALGAEDREFGALAAPVLADRLSCDGRMAIAAHLTDGRETLVLGGRFGADLRDDRTGVDRSGRSA